MKIILWIVFSIIYTVVSAQNENIVKIDGQKDSVKHQYIKGTIKDKETNEPLEFATIFDPISKNYATSSEEGRFEIQVPKSTQFIDISYIGYKEISYSIVYNVPDEQHLIYLESASKIMDKVTVVGSSFKDIIGVPVSLKTTSAALIKMNAGGGGDFTKLIQSLPGLTTMNSFRNDLIVRGGSPTENTFFINDIEVPYINHLSTQGSTGGTISILNAQQIREVDFIASGFPANRPDAMSGVFNIYLEDPSKEKKLIIGNDPTNIFLSGSNALDNSSISFSTRKSYRQHILKQIGLAVLPDYTDFLVNLKTKISDQSYLSLLAVGSKDDFTVNQDINDSEIQQYLRDNLPTNQQSSFTSGVSLKHLKNKSTYSLKFSYSRFTNAAQKENQIDGENLSILDFDSFEDQITAQLETYQEWNKLKIKYGGGTKFNQANYQVVNQFYDLNGLNLIDYNAYTYYNISHVFLQTTFGVVPEKFQLTMHNTFQVSNVRNQGLINSLPYPRINGKISLRPSMDFNFSIGQYSQLPENILLSFRQNEDYVNLDATKFIRTFQIATGLELFKENAQNQFTIESFYKSYYNYPFNKRENISLANFGADFGVVGNVPIDFIGEGRAFGIELFFKRTNTKRLSGWLSYALSKSEFQDANLDYKVSSWDARHILNGVLSYRYNDKWSLSLNAKYQSALPYTPYDIESSSFAQVWDVNRIGIRDFTRLNSERGKSTALIDLRIQRQLKWKNKDIIIYLDLENVLADADSQQVLVFDRDETNMPVIINPQAPRELQKYKLKEIQNAEGVFIPSFGFELRL